MKMKKTTMRLLACVLALFVVVSALAGTAFAKYITERRAQDLLEARDFRFESNYLTVAGATYDVYGDSVEIILMNNDGLTISKGDITYTIEVTEGATIDNSGTLAGGTGNSNTHTLFFDGVGPVTVVTTSMSDYEKTIQATFNFIQPEGYYTVTDGERFVRIDVYTADAVASPGITVEGIEGLIPDATNDLLGTDGNIGALAADSHYTFVYFKSTDVGYVSVTKTVLPDTNIITLARE